MSETDTAVQTNTVSEAGTVAEAAGATDPRAGRTAADLDAAAAPAAADSSAAEPSADLPSLEDLEEAMRDVVDPELGINVVDLGLVYDIRVDADRVATVDMTLTSAACPLTDVIEAQARTALTEGGMCSDLKINWVWMPPWGPDKINEDGREQLRALGFTV
ncbi:metal-sulfur cluster assembly factor [Rhodococcus sp. X156]|uniref:metal-sulfur cluster assembly factor n=1 Tax=Rhodococcus sp. X156 TaxID=2499145 RepID=UPI000FD7CF45|nr:metal-sulfur cluster assembly factor [Rhodococcus sp. X156]